MMRLEILASIAAMAATTFVLGAVPLVAAGRWWQRPGAAEYMHRARNWCLPPEPVHRVRLTPPTSWLGVTGLEPLTAARQR